MPRHPSAARSVLRHTGSAWCGPQRWLPVPDHLPPSGGCTAQTGWLHRWLSYRDQAVCRIGCVGAVAVGKKIAVVVPRYSGSWAYMIVTGVAGTPSREAAPWSSYARLLGWY